MARLVRILCKGDKMLNMAIRDDRVVLARADPHDLSQQWLKDYSNTGKVTDDCGQRAFALVNKATGQALVNKHIPRPADALVPVQLAPYNGKERVDLSMLWTKGSHLDGDFCELRVLRDCSKTLMGCSDAPTHTAYHRLNRCY
ncbi:uncharacterized protein C2845_PM05G18120 [Panicum miliaceum]|uniref:Uncharacterized protein n=1 Tax=Panicum miliaceum TaxID=4540 RepID=A0A3L6T285_PANMI|nr:uncharacterized protein C2845_PM05G18120 [Panicum miliaceum]